MRADVKLTNLSRRQIARRMKQLGTPVSKNIVKRLLRDEVYRRRKPQKKRTMGQQSKGRLASLISAMPMVLRRWEASSVGESLSSVSTRQMHLWVNESLGQTRESKRRIAFAEASLETIG